ncbi:MAG: hypothetical protein ACRC8A_07590 [Microcoleaceae cyanobacterium]
MKLFRVTVIYWVKQVGRLLPDAYAPEIQPQVDADAPVELL